MLSSIHNCPMLLYVVANQLRTLPLEVSSQVNYSYPSTLLAPVYYHHQGR